MIKRIYIDNYKCFVNFELRLQELTLLLGRNGAGKTSVLNVLYALRRLLDGTARVTDRDIFPRSSRTRWQDRATQVFEVEVELIGDLLVYRVEVEHDLHERRARIMLEDLSGNGGPLFRFERGTVQLYRDNHSKGPEFPSDWTESALARVVSVSENTRLTRFLDFIRNLVVCRLNPPAFNAEATDEDQNLARDGSNFVRFYRHLLQERQHLYPEYAQEMQRVLHGLRGFRLEKIGTEARALVGIFGTEDEQWEYKFSELSDGQRALIVLYALTSLTAGQDRALLIDEPFNYVGLREIQPWLITLADACGSAFPQAVLCSHHPEVIDYLGASRSVLLSRDEVGPTRAEPLGEALEELTQDGPLKLSQIIARGWER
jgi:predicted ATPase